jgi:hypothetical protein
MNNKLQPQEVFSNNDLGLTGALVSLGHKLMEVDKTMPRASFLFERTAGLEHDTELYWLGDLRIEPKTYFDSLKGIKSRLYSN